MDRQKILTHKESNPGKRKEMTTGRKKVLKFSEKFYSESARMQFSSRKIFYSLVF